MLEIFAFTRLERQKSTSLYRHAKGIAATVLSLVSLDKVLLFKLEKINYSNDGFIDTLKYKCDDVFLFIFADEYNLILTKSKCDLLDDMGELYDEELKLTITHNT